MMPSICKKRRKAKRICVLSAVLSTVQHNSWLSVGSWAFVKEDVYENELEMCVCTTTVRRAKKESQVASS